ncbi:hypothetical protein Taro_014161 [Colocasia esculenta]|uniref:Uncharacterized protein n=1 Tax=Colocasia esculenta TaxID=4460 RepID=A0A843UE53_COLES|nr:hypothetical protein [Colocasia esculenta]
MGHMRGPSSRPDCLGRAAGARDIQTCRYIARCGRLDSVLADLPGNLRNTGPLGSGRRTPEPLNVASPDKPPGDRAFKSSGGYAGRSDAFKISKRP